MNPPETIAAQMNLSFVGAVMPPEGNAFIDVRSHGAVEFAFR